ncbi:cation:proton antiporter [Herbiconiux flava]|uniref:CPA1 family monovalent cation:H+ antiporter n=1 Tax=Herbiconiux flava TaxID=881268 RepID=A0A852SPA5_9MICO|nr:cation:proton antiporter [Herbiconiux flava]NYD70624.1 CPA1 family monovalent cation:H+ antiporter [Herbiconiux flava]
MEADAVGTIVWIVSFVVVTVAVTGVAGRVGWSAPVALVAVGALVSFIPGVPTIAVEPDLILYGLLPPLLFAAAIRTSFADVRARRDGILLLSVGLVVFTVVTVGLTAWLIIPAISLAAAFAFGAVVAPTDAVAVTAIAGRLKLPRRLVTVLEGESLLNDATALVALNAAIAAIVSANTPGAEPLTPWGIILEFVIAVAVGVGVGLLVGWVFALIRKQLRSPVLDTSLSLITPFVAFIPAQFLHGSGVLAVVVAGLYLGFKAPVIQTAESRIAESLNWRTIQFLLENAVFLFIGLSLFGIFQGVADSGPGLWPTVVISVVLLLAIFLSRFVWMIFTTSVYRFGPGWLRNRGWSWRNGIAVSFAGIRGVVTLAAVFLLPEETPERSFLQFLAFVVVVGTLVEGAFLPFVIRRLRLPPPDFSQEMTEVHMLMAEAQGQGLARLESEVTDADEQRVVDRLRLNATFLTDALENPSPEGTEPPARAYNRLRRIMIEAERQAVLQARSEGRYQERAVKSVLAKIDVEETELNIGKPRKGE